MMTQRDRLARDIAQLAASAVGPHPPQLPAEVELTAQLEWAIACPASSGRSTVEAFAGYLTHLVQVHRLPGFTARRALVTACERVNLDRTLMNQAIDDLGVNEVLYVLAEAALAKAGTHAA